jgi:hypothetical protein
MRKRIEVETVLGGVPQTDPLSRSSGTSEETVHV